MKTALILFFMASCAWATAPTGTVTKAVMVNSNGVLVIPTNFIAANGISTGASSAAYAAVAGVASGLVGIVTGDIQTNPAVFATAAQGSNADSFISWITTNLYPKTFDPVNSYTLSDFVHDGSGAVNGTFIWDGQTNQYGQKTWYQAADSSYRLTDFSGGNFTIAYFGSGTPLFTGSGNADPSLCAWIIEEGGDTVGTVSQYFMESSSFSEADPNWAAMSNEILRLTRILSNFNDRLYVNSTLGSDITFTTGNIPYAIGADTMVDGGVYMATEVGYLSLRTNGNVIANGDIYANESGQFGECNPSNKLVTQSSLTAQNTWPNYSNTVRRGVMDHVNWIDLIAPGMSLAGGTAAPQLIDTGIGVGIKGMGYDLNDIAYGALQMPHGLALTNATRSTLAIAPHLHWACPGATNPPNLNVTWELAWEWANIGAGFTLYGTNVITTSIASQTGHLIAAFGMITNNAAGISSMFRFRLGRTTSASNDYGATRVLLDQFDIHVPVDRLGSEQEIIQ